MQAEFWQQRWDNNQTGFHLQQTNPNLPRYWPQDVFSDGDTVFVPLCGKSLDLLWFARQGLQVLGVELIEAAVLAFFHENGLSYERKEREGFSEFVSGSIRILCGDFFRLTASDLAGCRGFYDRAALVAWQPQRRPDYVAHLLKILPAGCRGLMLVLDYPQEQMQGPPFAVGKEDMQTLFGRAGKVRLLGSRDILIHEPGFRARGVSRMEEHAYQLIKT